MKTKILVTGGAGSIGSALVHRLISFKDFEVIVVDNLCTGNFDNLPNVKEFENFKFIRCDVNDYNDINPVMTFNNFDYVFHYAAVVGVQRTLMHPVSVLKDFEGFKNIFTLAKNTLVKRVFFSSSSEVYGEPFEFPQNENTTPLNSRLPYAVMKNVGESFLKAYHKEFNMNYTILRFFNTYGPNQTSDFVIPRFIKAALNNSDITIYGNGSQTRTFCYIDDNIDTILKIFQQNLVVNDIINIGSDIEYSVLDLANIIIKLTGSKSKIVHLPCLKEGDMARRKPDISKMKNILNKDLIPLEEGLMKMISIYKKS